MFTLFDCLNTFNKYAHNKAYFGQVDDTNVKSTSPEQKLPMSKTLLDCTPRPIKPWTRCPTNAEITRNESNASAKKNISNRVNYMENRLGIGPTHFESR